MIHQDRLDQLQKAVDTKQSPSELIESLLDRVEHAYFVHDAVQRNANIRTALAVLLSR